MRVAQVARGVSAEDPAPPEIEELTSRAAETADSIAEMGIGNIANMASLAITIHWRTRMQRAQRINTQPLPLIVPLPVSLCC